MAVRSNLPAVGAQLVCAARHVAPMRLILSELMLSEPILSDDEADVVYCFIYNFKQAPWSLRSLPSAIRMRWLFPNAQRKKSRGNINTLFGTISMEGASFAFTPVPRLIHVASPSSPLSLSSIRSAAAASLLTPDPDLDPAECVRELAVAPGAMATADDIADGEPVSTGDDGTATADGVTGDAGPAAVAGGVTGSSSGQ
jgi:hypothetical protein